MNDLTNISTVGNFILFADDTNIIYTDQNLQNLTIKVNDDLEKITQWFNKNKLSLNVSKTKFIQFNSYNSTSSNIPIRMNNIDIESASVIKFLGVYLQNDLSWNIHINEKAKQVSKTIGCLSRLKNFFPKDTLLTIYRSLIEPHLTYSILAWGTAPKKNLNRLCILQKRAIRIINKSKYNSHTDPIFKKFKCLKLNDLFSLHCCKLYHKKLNRKIPEYHQNLLLTREEQNFTRLTRQNENVYIFPIATQTDKARLNYTVGNTWNNLPKELKDYSIKSYSTFMRKIKQHYFSNYQENCIHRNCFVCTSQCL